MGVQMQKNWEQMLVSVVIPTYNSARFLGVCLESLKNQSWKELEVIVVDDGSTDGTLEIAEKYECIVINNPTRGRAEAKNEGIKHSVGDFFFFIDSDMELTRNAISKCVQLARETPSIGGVVVPERSVGKSFWVRVRDFERSFYSESVIESARFFPAKLAKEVGGFEERLVFFEESTLPYKIQRKGHCTFLRTNPMVLHHEEDFSLMTWLRKKFYYGKTIHLYRERYGDFLGVQISIPFRLGLFMNDRRRFLSKPKLALGLILLKSLEYFATNAGQVHSKIVFTS
jgi:glycosyltransferase involved in cell wall biosynthesis